MPGEMSDCLPCRKASQFFRVAVASSGRIAVIVGDHSLTLNAYMNINYPDFSCPVEKNLISGEMPHHSEVAVQVEEFIV